MTIIYLTKFNTRCYGVTIQNNGLVKVQKYEGIYADENIVYCVKPLKIFLGRSEVCDMTVMSRACDKSVFDGNTIFLKISVKNDRHRYVYIGGNMVCSFLTNDNIYEYISNMGINLIPYSIVVGMENIYFLRPHFKFIRGKKVDYDNLLETNGYSVDPYDYHVAQCGKDSFKKLGTYKIHSNYDLNNIHVQVYDSLFQTN